MMGIEPLIPTDEFYLKQIQGRSSLTKGVYHTDRMKSHYIMEDYLSAYAEVVPMTTKHLPY
jgi:hypothetical protein